MGLGWAITGSQGIPGAGQLVVLVVAVVITVLLARRMRELASGGNAGSAAWVRRRFLLVLAAELLAVAAIALFAGATGDSLVIAPSVAIVVGLHFIPLAAIFGVPIYRVTGSALVSVGAVALVARFGGSSASATLAITGLGTATALWSTASTLLSRTLGSA
jgi:hypothetical protein